MLKSNFLRRNGTRSNLTLKEVVADNLRRLCESDGRSIAYICKTMRISRSQFDRYLSAENLPNEGTAKTIAKFFRIAEVDLFQVGFQANVNVAAEFDQGLRNLAHYPAPRLPTGIYFMYFNLQSDPSHVLCSTVNVRRAGDILGFVRLTGFSKHRYSNGSFFRGRHYGMIVERHQWLYFSAVNMIPDYEPSLVMFRWMLGDEDLLPGKASILTEKGAIVADVALERAPEDLPLGIAARMARIYSSQDPFVGDDVINILRKNRL
jgi:transcriptional regulator with XRE-family HTH domain